LSKLLPGWISVLGQKRRIGARHLTADSLCAIVYDTGNVNMGARMICGGHITSTLPLLSEADKTGHRDIPLPGNVPSSPPYDRPLLHPDHGQPHSPGMA
jgi:hypothetical protein